MTGSWITLVAGAAGGAALTATYNALMTRATWKREDRHRFAATRQELYARFLATWENYAEKIAQASGDEKAAADARDDERSAALTEAIESGRAKQKAIADLIRVTQEVVLIGGDDVRSALDRLLLSKPSEDDRNADVWKFLKAARVDLGIDDKPRRRRAFPPLRKVAR